MIFQKKNVFNDFYNERTKTWTFFYSLKNKTHILEMHNYGN